jgi:hypothetical protein
MNIQCLRIFYVVAVLHNNSYTLLLGIIDLYFVLQQIFFLLSFVSLLFYPVPYSVERCPKLVDQRKQDKLPWLQDPSEANEGNLSDIRREASRHFRNKEREYLKDKINELELNSKNKKIRDLYRGINEFKKGYQPRTNLAKGERGDLVADPHKILNRWKNYFCQVLNVHGAGGVGQTEMHTAEPFVPEPSSSEIEVAIGKLKRYKSPAVDQIPAELIQAGGGTLRSEIHKLIKLIWNKEELPHQWKE